MQGEMMVELLFENNSMIRLPLSLEYWDGRSIEHGSWDTPLPNERGNSFAFGLVEMLAQTDEWAGALFELESRSPLKRVRTWPADQGRTVAMEDE